MSRAACDSPIPQLDGYARVSSVQKQDYLREEIKNCKTIVVLVAGLLGKKVENLKSVVNQS